MSRLRMSLGRWRERKREKQRLEDLRTGDSLEKRARRARQGGPPPEPEPSRAQMGFEVMGDPGWRIDRKP